MKVGVIMNGVTGRMGTNQHLVRSLLAIRRQGGIPIPGGEPIWPEPILVGRSEAKLRALAGEHDLPLWSTDLDACLGDSRFPVYFDAQATSVRVPAVQAAIEAGKHVYCEKPIASDLGSALDLVRQAQAVGVKHGVVQDKIFLPGLAKLRRLRDAGFFGRILALRGEFGYWVFEGDWQVAQRPAWNYRAEDGGGIVLDMFCHWNYVLAHLVAPVTAVSATAVTHIPERVDEAGKRYRATADDAAFAIFELEGGAVAQLNSSWATRVFRSDLLTLQIDGTEGSAVAGLRECWVQHRTTTPRAVWNPDLPREIDYQRAGWQEVPDNQVFENAFKVQWKLFLRHVACNGSFPWTLLEGARGVQLAELGLRSSRERRWLAVPEFEV